MIQVAKITEEQKDIIAGMQYNTGMYFNPIEDMEGNWILSLEEVNACNVTAFVWVKSLPLIEFIPLQNDINI